MEPLFLEGVLQEKIWGGSKLKTEFGYEIPSNKTGELWAISAHPNGPAKVKNGIYRGLTIKELWENHRELFGNEEGDVFPLLTKIIDAEEDLSVQVHPNDAYGLKHEGELGKTECWYVLASDPGAKIVYGHHAKTKSELRQQINNEEWKKLLRYVEVKPGDFFYLPSGTIHALGSGIMVLETQQSSDTTYRLYDYNRKDDTGKLRDLHTEKSIEVATIPHENHQRIANKKEVKNGLIEKLISTKFFTVYKWNIEGLVDFKRDALYTLVSVIKGKGYLIVDDHEYQIKKGDHFILPNSHKKWQLNGYMELIASHT